MDMRKNIRSLEDLKPMTVTLLKQSHLEKISLPNLKVSKYLPAQRQTSTAASMLTGSMSSGWTRRIRAVGEDI